VFGQPVTENRTVAFGASLTIKNFPLLTSSQNEIPIYPVPDFLRRQMKESKGGKFLPLAVGEW
jgi:hypothetical protein